MDIPKGLLYTKEHEWVKIDGKKAKVGITNYAEHSLGDITFVELPKTGASFKQFKQFATVESVKAASDVYAPISGKIVQVNDELKTKPEIVNQSPYDKGWFAILEISDEKEKNNLMTSSKYEEYLKGLSK